MSPQEESPAPVPPAGTQSPVFASGSKLLDGVDLASAAGLKKLEVKYLTANSIGLSYVDRILHSFFFAPNKSGSSISPQLLLIHAPTLEQVLLKGKTFLGGGSRPDAEDSCVYAACSRLPSSMLRSAPAVKGWLNTIGMFAPSMRSRWGNDAAIPSSDGVGVGKAEGGSEQRVNGSAKAPQASSVAPAAPAVKTKEIKGGDNDDMDDLFGDEEELEGTAQASGATSRAEKMAAAKAEKIKKKKIDRYAKGVVQ